VPRTLDPDAIAAKNGITPNSAWVWLLRFEISSAEFLYLTSGDEAVSYDGKTWLPMPFSVGDFEEDERSNLTETTIEFDDPKREIARIVLRNPDLDGSEVLLYQHVNGQATESMRFSVEDNAISTGKIAFRLGNATAVANTAFPSRVFSRDRCNNEFGGPACGFVITDPADFCDFTMRGANGCAAHANQGRMRACPGVI